MLDACHTGMYRPRGKFVHHEQKNLAKPKVRCWHSCQACAEKVISQCMQKARTQTKLIDEPGSQFEVTTRKVRYYSPGDGVFPLLPGSSQASCPHSLGLPMISLHFCLHAMCPLPGGGSRGGPAKTWAFRGSDSSQDCSTWFKQYVPYKAGSLAYAAKKIFMPLLPPSQQVFNRTIPIQSNAKSLHFSAATFACKWLRKTAVAVGKC